MHAFLQKSRYFGFFLEISNNIGEEYSTSAILGVYPTLLDIVCAFGARILSSQAEEKYLTRALDTNSPDGSQPKTLLHAIQTEVIFGYYFWCKGAFLRARGHAASAVALTIGSGLHVAQDICKGFVVQLIPSAQQASGQIIPQHIPYAEYSAKERTCAVTAVFGLQIMLSAALDPSGCMCNISLPASILESPLARAQLVLHRTAAFVELCQQSAGITTWARGELFGLFVEVQEARRWLGPRCSQKSAVMPGSGGLAVLNAQDSHHSTYLGHTILDGVTIRLHEVRESIEGYQEEGAAQSVHAATEILHNLQTFTSLWYPPIFGTMFVWAVQSLARELARARLDAHQRAEYVQELNLCLVNMVATLRQMRAVGQTNLAMVWDMGKALKSAEAVLRLLPSRDNGEKV
ncbi:Zn(2)-C6 fungal-type domain-containing protein [Mycena kentingensis (nom. inval.)]|nr:Zn(2)-C6 fungal-type domain-containing protein [Mycena kentingensis (nom. inval.)]